MGTTSMAGPVNLREIKHSDGCTRFAYPALPNLSTPRMNILELSLRPNFGIGFKEKPTGFT